MVGTLCHLPTNGVVGDHGSLASGSYKVDYLLIVLRVFGGLSKYFDGSGWVYGLDLSLIFDENAMTIGLPHEPNDLGMSFFAKDDDLPSHSRGVGIGQTDALLEFEDHGACGIGEVEVVLADDIVGSRGLAMGTEEDGDVGECGQIGCFDDLEAFVSESVNFSLVVYDVSNAIEVFAGGQLFLEGGNGTSDSEAEA